VNDKSASAIAAWEALFRAQVSVLRVLGHEFPSGQISFTEYDVLFNLSKQIDRRLRIRDLNRHLLLTQPSVSRMVDRLVAKGLVRKEADPADGRATYVVLTDAGYDLFRRVGASHAASIARLVGGALTIDELEQLTMITDKLRARVEETDA
jgi:DNA-binding MarR family transcriptional regulator